MLFLLKIILPPILVAAVSLAARFWGPTVGGLLMGLPVMTGPVLFFLIWERGPVFGVEACAGVEIGVVGVCAYTLAYGRTAAFAPWMVCLPVGLAAFVVAAWAFLGPAWSVPAAAAIAATALLVTYLLLPRPVAAAPLAALPWWDIPMRMGATLGLVAVITVTADLIGPQLSGIVSTLPVITTVVGSFTHRQWGANALNRMLRSLTLSLLAFVVFFLVVGSALPHAGLVLSFVLAGMAALPVSALLLVLGRMGLLR